MFSTNEDPLVVGLIRNPLYYRALNGLKAQGPAQRRLARYIDRTVIRCIAHSCMVLHDGGELTVVTFPDVSKELAALQIPYQGGYVYVVGLLRFDPTLPGRAALELLFISTMETKVTAQTQE